MSHIENMEQMIECLTNKAKFHLDSGTENVDAEEFGEVIDAIKDLAEAKYKCTVTKAMKDAEEEDKMMEKLGIDSEERRFYRGFGKGRRNYFPEYMDYGRMYYPSGISNTGMGYSGYGNSMNTSSGYSGNSGRMNYGGMYGYGGSRRNYGDNDYQRNESRYDRARRNYTESKQLHSGNTSEDKQAKVRELEEYMSELSSDMTELIVDMTPEEKNTMRNKLNQLISKI